MSVNNKCKGVKSNDLKKVLKMIKLVKTCRKCAHLNRNKLHKKFCVPPLSKMTKSVCNNVKKYTIKKVKKDNNMTRKILKFSKKRAQYLNKICLKKRRNK